MAIDPNNVEGGDVPYEHDPIQGDGIIEAFMRFIRNSMRRDASKTEGAGQKIPTPEPTPEPTPTATPTDTGMAPGDEMAINRMALRAKRGTNSFQV